MRDPRRTVGLVVVVGLTLLAAACGGGHPAAKKPVSKTQTTAVTADHWRPPIVPGPPSTTKFCTLLVAQYEHIQTNALATTMKVRKEIISDYVNFTPTLVAAAPSTIAPAAGVYLRGIAQVLTDLNNANLNAANAPKGQIGSIITDPKVQAAGNQLIGFSQQYCHYDISGQT